MKKRLFAGIYVTFAFLSLTPLCLTAQSTTNWVVRPEWVKAHEDFLASDVMAGRGSATRDEEITATYVASEFEAYGLKPAPGLTSYLQSAAIESPVLDHHATFTRGSVTLQEGADFDLVISSAQPVSGAMAVASVDQAASLAVSPGALILLTGTSNKALQAYNLLSRKGASLVALDRDTIPAPMLARLTSKTRIQMTVQDGTPRKDQTLVLLSHTAAQRLASQAENQAATLTVHPVPQAPRHTFNAIGYLQGSDPASGTLLLTAHLDHLGTASAGDGDRIYNGANDDAAGTTAVLELAHALGAGPRPRRSILFVCYGSEEAGELGSTFFGKHPPVPLHELVANLEFEMIGTQDPKMPKNTLLLTGWDLSNLGPTLKQHGALLGPDPYPEEHFFERSDNYSLALQGIVAHTAAGWGTVPTYHQPNDDLEHLDLGFMTAAIQSLIEPVTWLASSDFRPAWNPGSDPSQHTDKR